MAKHKLDSYRSVIDLWPTRVALSEELGHLDSKLVRKWWQRNSIPVPAWLTLVSLYKAQNAGVTLKLLANLGRKRGGRRINKQGENNK